VIPLDREGLTLGRAKDNDVVLPDEELADLEATLRWEDGRWILSSCGPETHLFERHMPVERCECKPDRPFRIGSTTFELTYRSSHTEGTPGHPAAGQPSARARSSSPGSASPDFFAGAAEGTPGGKGAGPGRQLSGRGPATRGSQLPAAQEQGSQKGTLPSGLEGQSGQEPPTGSRYVALAKAGNLLYTLLIVSLVLGGALLVHVLGRQPPEPPVKHALIQEGADGTIVSVYPHKYDRIGKSGEDSLWLQTVDVRPVEPRFMVELSGKNQGAARVPLFLRDKRVVTLRVTVRGRAYKEPVFGRDRDLGSLLSQAEALLERGRHLERDHLHQAIEQCYRPATQFLAEIDELRAQRLEMEAERLLRAAEQELDQRIEKLDDEFWQSYRVGDYRRSLRQLELILEWIPDASDKRHQRAAIIADILRRETGQ